MHFNKVLAVLSFAVVAIAAPHPNAPSTSTGGTGAAECNIGSQKGGQQCCSSDNKVASNDLKSKLQGLGAISGLLGGLLGGLDLSDLLKLNLQAGIACMSIPSSL